MKSAPMTGMLLAAMAVANAAETNVATLGSAEGRERGWKEDLEYLAQELPAKHLDFYKLISKEKFEREIRRLENELPRVSDQEIVFRLMRLVASLGVAHTRAGSPPRGPAFHGYPFLLNWYSDGLAVIAATPEWRELLGAKVVKIGSKTPERAVAAVAPYISHENEAWLYQQSTFLLRHCELLQYLGIAQPDGRVRLSLTRPDGKLLSVEVAPVASEESVKWVSVSEALNIRAPLAVKRHGPYWYEFFPAPQALYIQYNVCEDVPGQPFAGFARDLFAAADSNTVRRVVVDLRWNEGGNSGVIKPLVGGLKARPCLSGKGRLYVLIGRKTFSSGLHAAIELQAATDATLVGAPTGGRPNHYGDSPSLRLPNSQLEVWYCTKKFRLLKNADPLSLEPDIRVPVSLQDVLAGRDPVLEAALQAERK